MHELAVAQSILNIALAKAKAKAAGATRITNIRVSIGALTTYVDDSIRFYWDTMTEGTIAAGSTIEFTRVEGRIRCFGCNLEFSTNVPNFECPECHGLWTHPLSGEECFVESIEVYEAEENDDAGDGHEDQPEVKGKSTEATLCL